MCLYAAALQLWNPNLHWHDNVSVHKATLKNTVFGVKQLDWSASNPDLKLNTFERNQNAECTQGFIA